MSSLNCPILEGFGSPISEVGLITDHPCACRFQGRDEQAHLSTAVRSQPLARAAGFLGGWSRWQATLQPCVEEQGPLRAGQSPGAPDLGFLYIHHFPRMVAHKKGSRTSGKGHTRSPALGHCLVPSKSSMKRMGQSVKEKGAGADGRYQKERGAE